MTLAYLDNAAAEPIREAARQAVLDAWERAGTVGLNPQAAHAAGREAAFLLDDARARVAACVGADPAEVVFTSGGTEGDVIAVRGAVREGRVIIHSALDHPAIAQTAAQAGPVRVLPLRADGGLDMDAARGIIAGDAGALEGAEGAGESAPPALVAATAVASETGVIVPIADLVALVRDTWGEQTVVHCDAVQAIGRIPCDFHALGVDTLAIAGHKFGGPAGVGVLLVRRGVALTSPITGGGQERGLRSGTPNVALAQGLAAAIEEATAQREAEMARHHSLRSRLLGGIAGIEDVRVATSAPAVESITMLLAAGCEAEPLLFALDQAGVAASAGSACHTGVARPSPALVAQGLSDAEAIGSLRVSFGWSTSEADVDALVAALPGAVEAARAFAAR